MADKEDTRKGDTRLFFSLPLYERVQSFNKVDE